MEDQEQHATPDADEALSDAAADTTKIPDAETEDEGNVDADEAMGDASFETAKDPDVTDSP